MDNISDRLRLQEIMIQTEKMMSLGGLAAGMAHEINNPLGIIMSSIQNSKRRLVEPINKNLLVADQLGIDFEKIKQYLVTRNIDKYFDAIESAVVRASNIVTDMLNFSRNSPGQKQHYTAKQIIGDAIHLASSDYDLKKKFDFRHLKIDQKIEEDLPPIFCSRNEIEQVILNLLKNSAYALSEYTVDSKKIEIRAFKQDNKIILKIIDNGPGMDADTKHRIFEPFFTTKPVGLGTGLGLSVSYFIITKNHNGVLSVESEQNKGTTFTIELPIKH